MLKTDITVLMVVRNEEKYVGATIKSVLSQTYKNFIFIIIDDGSTDDTWQVIKSFKDPRIKAVRHSEHNYLTKRLNEGLKMVTTEFIARMDSHNTTDKTRLEKQRNFLLENKEVVLVGSNFIRQNENGEVISQSNFPLTWGEIKNKIVEKNLFKHASWFARYETLKKENFYNESFRFAQDYEFLLRLALKYPLANIKESLLTEVKIKEAVSQKHKAEQSLFAFKAQLFALTKYGFPLRKSFYLLRGLAFFLKSFLS